MAKMTEAECVAAYDDAPGVYEALRTVADEAYRRGVEDAAGRETARAEAAEAREARLREALVAVDHATTGWHQDLLSDGSTISEIDASLEEVRDLLTLATGDESTT